MSETIIKPLRPSGEGWAGPYDVPLQYTLGYEGYAWFHAASGLFVMSCVEVAIDKDGIDRGPEYHVSVSKRATNSHHHQPTRASSSEAAWVLHAFGDLGGFEEDNHVPNGVARNFWRPVAEPFVGMECACKEDEPAIVLEKGDYVWRP